MAIAEKGAHVLNSCIHVGSSPAAGSCFWWLFFWACPKSPVLYRKKSSARCFLLVPPKFHMASRLSPGGMHQKSLYRHLYMVLPWNGRPQSSYRIYMYLLYSKWQRSWMILVRLILRSLYRCSSEKLQIEPRNWFRWRSWAVQEWMPFVLSVPWVMSEVAVYLVLYT